MAGSRAARSPTSPYMSSTTNRSSSLQLAGAAGRQPTTGAAAVERQRPAVVWLTGLSGAGKTTIARELERRLRERGAMVGMLDGDDLRDGLCQGLGFSPADRAEQSRRAAETARLMARAGLIVIVSLISPFRESRAHARGLFADGEFFEVHVNTPLEVAESRDPKGLYRRARSGELPQFTGIDSPYEAPEAPELRLDTVGGTPADCALEVLEMLEAAGRLPARAPRERTDRPAPAPPLGAA